MYEERPNGGMMETDSYNVEFFEDEFSIIGEIKTNLELYKRQQEVQTISW